MTPNTSPSPKEEGSDTIALELYKTAFARLNFQDEYLFKFSTVFLAAHGALATLAGSAFFRENAPNYPALAIAGGVGVFLALVWFLWTRHNDHWHSVWTGVLRDIESKHLKTEARVFALQHIEIARQGKRSGRFLLSGHHIAQLVPLGVGFAWACALYVGCEVPPVFRLPTSRTYAAWVC